MALATVTKEHVFKLMRDNECAYWVVMDSDQKHNIDANQDPETNVESSVEQLRECFTNCTGSGSVYVEIKNKTKAETGRGGNVRAINFSFRVRVDEQSTTGTTATGDTKTVAGLMDTIKGLELELQQKDFDYKMADMERKIEEIKEADPLKAYMPMIMQFMSANGAQVPPGMAGTDGTAGADEPEVKANKQNVDRLANLLRRLEKLDPDYVTLLEAIAVMGESDPEQFGNYSNLLKTNLKNAQNGGD